MTPYVLVVEDEDALGALLQYNLDKEGYRVAVATDGEEALVLIDEALPDLIVLDWMLPKVSGVEICRRLRARPMRKACAAAASAVRWPPGPSFRSRSKSPAAA